MDAACGYGSRASLNPHVPAAGQTSVGLIAFPPDTGPASSSSSSGSSSSGAAVLSGSDLAELDWLGDVALVATDLDGTLLDASSEVSPRAKDAIAAARAAGVLVVPATGRPPSSLRRITATCELGPIAVCSNGAVVIDIETEDVLDLSPIDGPSAVSLIATIREACPGVRFALDDVEHFSYERGFFPEDRERTDRLQPLDDLAEKAREGCLKLIARQPGTEGVTLMNRLGRLLGERAEETSSGLDWVEIMAHGVSKGAALARICSPLGLSAEQVVAIGDNYNDLALLAWAGHAMAPANAVEAVLPHVEVVLPTNTDDGVALLLEALVATRG